MSPCPLRGCQHPACRQPRDRRGAGSARGQGQPGGAAAPAEFQRGHSSWEWWWSWEQGPAKGWGDSKWCPGAHPSPQPLPAAHKCPLCLLKGLGSAPWTCSSHLRPATKLTRHSVCQCCHKGLDSKQLRQDSTYIPKAIKPFLQK